MLHTFQINLGGLDLKAYLNLADIYYQGIQPFLIKTHKTDQPIRPIISAINTPPEKLSFILTKILTQCQSKIPTLLKDSYQFLKRINEQFSELIEPSWILFSMDITSMYTNVPIDDCKLKVLNFISQHAQSINLYGLSYPDLENIMHTQYSHE